MESPLKCSGLGTDRAARCATIVVGVLTEATMTTHRYAHLDADPMRRAAETIGAKIAAAMGGTCREPVVVSMAKSR
jgi:hypothetical protein